MFSLLKKNKELEALILKLYNDASNNYKDNAQEDFKKLEGVYSALTGSGKLSRRQTDHYGKILEDYRAMLRDFTHANQGRKDIGTWKGSGGIK